MISPISERDIPEKYIKLLGLEDFQSRKKKLIALVTFSFMFIIIGATILQYYEPEIGFTILETAPEDESYKEPKKKEPEPTITPAPKEESRIQIPLGAIEPQAESNEPEAVYNLKFTDSSYNEIVAHDWGEFDKGDQKTLQLNGNPWVYVTNTGNIAANITWTASGSTSSDWILKIVDLDTGLNWPENAFKEFNAGRQKRIELKLTEASSQPGILYNLTLTWLIQEYQISKDSVFYHTYKPYIKPPRMLVAAPISDKSVGLSWRFDDKSTTYNIYRSTTRGSEYLQIATELTTTSYVDKELTNGITYYYVVRAVRNGIESDNSKEAIATSTADPKDFNKFLTIDESDWWGGNGKGSWGRVGDLNSDGNIDFLFQKGALYIRAFDHNGRLMWEKVMKSQHNWGHNNWSMEPQPTVIWDIDEDGENEVITGNYYENGKYYLAILDGATGKIEKKKPLSPNRMRSWGSLANFRGTSKPQDFIIGYGAYSKWRLQAYDNNLNLLWSWNYSGFAGDQGHRFKVGDVDYDGIDEVGIGEILLWGEVNPHENDRVRWVVDKSDIHQDSIEIVELDGDTSNGKEVLVGYNAPANKLMLINGKTGNLKWEKSYGDYHCVHNIEPFEYDLTNKGKEILFYAKGMKKFFIIDDKNGDVLSYVTYTFDEGDDSNEANSILWQGNEDLDVITVTKIFDSDLNTISKRPEQPTSEMYLFISGDIIGDYREEYFAVDDNGNISIYTNASYNPSKKQSFWETDWFRVWTKYLNPDDF